MKRPFERRERNGKTELVDARHRNVHTLALDYLGDGIRGALREEDAVFIKALPALLSPWPEHVATLARVKKVVRGKNAFDRLDAIWKIVSYLRGSCKSRSFVSGLSLIELLAPSKRSALLTRAERDEPDLELGASPPRACDSDALCWP